MEVNNIVKYVWIAIGLIICISLKIYFGSNFIVNKVDDVIEDIVEDRTGYDIGKIVDVV